jgi:hypothetical protein
MKIRQQFLERVLLDCHIEVYRDRVMHECAHRERDTQRHIRSAIAGNK